MEILRCANTVPHGGSRSTTADVVVEGVLIPKDTNILGIFAEVLQGEYWEKGDCFNPERFLDKDGSVRHEERLIPFSVGKRVCPGQALATVQIFLYLVRMLQLFNLHPLDENNLPEVTFTAGVASTPTPFQLIFSNRP